MESDLKSMDRNRDDIFSIYLKNIKGIHFDNTWGLQIIYIIQGELNIEIKDKLVVGQGGDLLVLNSFENRFIYSRTKDNLSIILNVENKYLKETKPSYKSLKLSNYIGENMVETDFIEKLIILYENREDKRDKENIKLIEDIVNRLFEFHIDKETYIPNMDYKMKLLAPINQLIGEREVEKLNLKYLSETLHLSQSYISKIFQEISGTSFTEFNQQLRLYISCYYILNTSLNMEEISELVGFNSPKSLNRIFNQYFNLNPSDYRREYKINEDQEFNFEEDFNKLKDSFATPEYYKFIQAEMDIVKVNHIIDTRARGDEIFQNWKIIRDLRGLGSNYLGGFEDIINQVEIKELALRFSLDIDGNLLLRDLNKPVNNTELSQVFSKCSDKNITPIIGLSLGKENLKKLDLQAIENIYDDFNNNISMIVGSNKMLDFRYFVDISRITAYEENSQDFRNYLAYIDIQQKSLNNKLGQGTYTWGFEIGNIDDKGLGRLQDIYMDFGQRQDLPTFLSLSFTPKRIKPLNSTKDFLIFKETIDNFLLKLNIMKEEVGLGGKKVYLRGFFQSLDISKIPIGYRDLFITTLMMESIFNRDINYIMDFSVLDRREEGGVYNPKIINSQGFNTPIYWLIRFLDQLKGDIVHNQPGCLVTRDKEDLYMIIYGNFLVDYFYSLSKDYLNLEKEEIDIYLEVLGLEGEYKITEKRLNYKYGTIEYNLGDLSDYNYLNASEQAYLDRITAPAFNLTIKNLSDKYIEELTYSPFTVIFKKYIKV